MPLSMRSISGRPSRPKPATLGALASPAGIDLAVLFVWAPPKSQLIETLPLAFY